MNCLLVDDDQPFSELLAGLVAAGGDRPHVAHSVADAKKVLAHQKIEIAFLDNKLPDGSGYELHEWLRQRFPGIVTIMITGAPDLYQAVELTRNGLFDYLTKPVKSEQFRLCLERARERNTPATTNQISRLLGDSGPIVRVRAFLVQAAAHPLATVLLEGETGTGKEVAARFLHEATFQERAATCPYVAVNCSAIPGEMIEAELFGSEKGAYTGADRRRIGLFQSAQGGTLFLDEIGELALSLQAKILRVLEAREFRSLGAQETKAFTGRIVAASNRPLRDEVRAGRFREDLLYRLDVMSIRLPALREHLEDLPLLARHLLEDLGRKYNRSVPHIVAANLEALVQYKFPGNVRELRNLLERSLLKSRPDEAWLSLDLEWLPSERAQVAAEPVATTMPANLTPVEAEEFRLIARALAEEGGGIRRAAAKVGLSHQSIIRRLEKWPELRQAAGLP